MIGLIFAASLLTANVETTEEQPIDCYISAASDYSAPGGVVTEVYILETETEEESTYDGPVLTKSGGTNYGPSGKETWYNLKMGRCIDIMRANGYSVEEYPYWVREDGAKMLGEYVMVAANTYIYEKGTLLETSLGTGIVVDHCVRSTYDPGVDICVTW